MNLFFDSSALIKLYHQEEGSEALNDYLELHPQNLMIIISDLTKIEFHSAFLRWVRMNEIELETVNEIFRAFENDVKMYHIIEVDVDVKTYAVQLLKELAHERGLRTLDAI